MQYYDAKLLTSAAKQSQWPDSDLPEIIFAGRSNAGKSTLINALVNRKNLAYSGKTPGKTRLLNFFSIDDRVVFTDCPGYGYAISNVEAAEAFGLLIDPYFYKRKQLKAMVLVLDARRVPNDDDELMIDYGRKAHLNILIICTKSDKISKSQLISSRHQIAQTLNVNEENILAVDSVKKIGMDEVWKRIDQIVAQSSKTLSA
jgi:GTP-binding protein